VSQVSVLVPWAGECPHRSAAFGYVTHWYARHFPDWTVHTGISETGPGWCKADALKDALAQTPADILVIADADCIAPGVGDAVRSVAADQAWAMPHYTVHRLNAPATRQVIQDDADPASFPRTPRHYAQMPYTGYAGGGITVVSRSAYAQAPMDPRFTGWGQEDESWALALRMLYGAPWRPRSGPLWHLWHPPQRRLSRAVGSENSRQLRSVYRRARTRASMEANLAIARAHVQEGLHPGVSRPVVSGEL